MKQTDAARLAAENGLDEKWDHLIQCLSSFNSAIVAFSGGVDSSFLAFAGQLVYGPKLLAVTLVSEFETTEMVELAERITTACGIRHKLLHRNNLENPSVRSNLPDRCYHCKFDILSTLWTMARTEGYDVVFDGQNTDDLNDYRPGMKAVQETGTISPLLSAGLNKAEIRLLSHAFGLETWDHPSSPCLASRIPYGTEITLKVLKQIAAGEKYLHEQNFKVVRVRVHGDLVRIEVAAEELDRLSGCSLDVDRFFKELGFKYVTLDLHGYRLGSLNEGINL